jgi:peptide/nickel transport system substrate-binding protein
MARPTLGVDMARPFDRRTFLTGSLAAAAAAAGAAALGDDPAGAVYTNGPGRNGIAHTKPKRGGTLVFGTDAEEQGFDPTSARYDEVGFLYARTVFDPVAIVTATGAVEPFLAQSITPNADYTAWTVTLRPNLVFHDGTPCDGAALLLNVEKQLASALTGPAIKSFVSSVTQTSPLAIRFNLTSPWVSFPYGLADSQLSYVAAPSMLNSADGTTHPVGTGPFRFGEWVPNSHYTAHRNPHYWRKNLPYLDTITFKPVVDPDARQAALQSGTVDIMVTNTPQNQVYFRGNKQWSYVDDTGKLIGEPDLNMIQLNCSQPPFNNRTLRHALARATNTKEFAKVIGLNIGAPVNGVFVPGTPYYSKTPYPKYDPHGAAQLVNEVKRTGGTAEFTLQLIPSPEIIRAAEFLQAEWQTAGMKVNLQEIQQNALINNALTGKYQAVTWRQFGAASPDLNYVWWSTETATVNGPYSINMARNVDPRIQTALLAARSSPSHHKSAAQYQQVNKLLCDDIPYVWLNRSPWAVVSSPKVQNWNNPTTPQGTKALGMHLGVIWPTQIWIS